MSGPSTPSVPSQHLQPLMQQHQQRLGAFDLLRFLAAVLVIGLHHGAWDSLTLNSPLTVGPPWHGIVKYGNFGVDIFFIISGYFVFLTGDGRSALDFTISRISRLYPAFLVCCTISFVVISCWGHLPPSETPHLRNYLGNITLVSFVTGFLPGFNGAGYVEGPYWTLAYEFVWYALVAGYLLRGPIHAAQRFLGLLTAASGVAWLVLLSGHQERLGQIGQFLPYFLLGAQLYLLTTYGTTRTGVALFTLNGGLVLLSIYYRCVGGLVHIPHLLQFNPLIAMLEVSLAVVVMVQAARGRLRIGGRVITLLGMSTYPLYLLHDKNGVVLAQHVSWLRGLHGLVLLTVLAVAVATLFASTLEPLLIATMRATLRRWCGISARRSPAPTAQGQQQHESHAAAEPAAATPAAATAARGPGGGTGTGSAAGAGAAADT